MLICCAFVGRQRLELGTHGEVTINRQKLVDVKWVKVDRGGDRWRARTTFRKLDGTDITLSGYGRTSKAAEAALQHHIDAQRGQRSGKITGRTLLVDVGAQWLEDIQRPDSGLSARSIDDYRRTYYRYIDVPGSQLRGLALSEADDPPTITAFLRHVADSHGAGAVKQCRVVLGHLFGMAIQARALKSSPMKDVKRVLPAVPKDTPRDTSRAFTREERDAVVTLAYELAIEDGLNPRTTRKRYAVADLVAFLAATGCRINEARELRWEDVSLDSGVVLVKGTKTEKALRQINLAPWALERLQARADRVGTEGLVFASPAHSHNLTPWDQSNSSNALNDLLRAAGHNWATPHSFRHTVVTHLHERNVPLHKIADFVGHEDVQTTARYLGRDLGSDKAGLAALL